MFKPGQVLEDESFYRSQHGGQVVFATVIEDADSIDPDTGFTVQECDTLCPSCGELISIRLLNKSIFTGANVLCLYCERCHLLFRKSAIGYLTSSGDYRSAI